MTYGIHWLSSILADNYDDMYKRKNTDREVWVRRAFPAEVTNKPPTKPGYCWYALVHKSDPAMRVMMYFEELETFNTNVSDEDAHDLFIRLVEDACAGKIELGIKVVK